MWRDVVEKVVPLHTYWNDPGQPSAVCCIAQQSKFLVPHAAPVWRLAAGGQQLS
jgi:hypothetical protein